VPDLPSGNAAIGQSGGPTAVINQSLAGVVEGLKAGLAASGKVKRILGMRHGVRGLVKSGSDGLVDLTGIDAAKLEAVARTPSAALGSTRDKPDAQYCERILAGLAKASADAFIYIGGNDTAGTLDILDRAAKGNMTFVHVPKTVDNDLVENDHTPGFPSAALFVVEAFLSVDFDVRSLPGIYVGVVMGRNAGFLTASAAAWRRDDKDGPHLVYVPETPFSVDKLIADVSAVRERFGRCVVAMSEGVASEDGTPLAAKLAGRVEKDPHGNVVLSGGNLGVALQERLTRELPKARVRVDTFGYPQRAFIGSVNPLDSQEAFEVGKQAIAASWTGSHSVAITVTPGKTEMKLVPLAKVAAKTRLMPAEFFDAKASQVTPAGMAYFARLLPPRPDVAAPFV
jgi:ATP-dependent phosphofructokinase / diphosphate-dependent phosphofructokinase